MKNFFLKDRYRKAITLGVVVMFSPLLFWLLLNIPSLIYPDDCGITFQCKHAVVQYAGELSLGLLILGIPIFLFGAGMVLISSFLYGIHALRTRALAYRRFKMVMGILAGLILLFVLWVPAGPDECSHTLTNRLYTSCLEKELTGKTEAEARTWLIARGYRTTESYPRSNWGSFAHENFSSQPSIQSYFEAYRSFGRPHSLPYGTNFARYALPMFPAPATYTIGVGIRSGSENTYDIYTDWSFSFL